MNVFWTRDDGMKRPVWSYWTSLSSYLWLRSVINEWMTDLDICQKGMWNVAVTSSTNTLQVCSRHGAARTKRSQFSYTLELSVRWTRPMSTSQIKSSYGYLTTIDELPRIRYVKYEGGCYELRTDSNTKGGGYRIRRHYYSRRIGRT